MYQLAAEQSQQLTRQNKSLAMYCSYKSSWLLGFTLDSTFGFRDKKKTQKTLGYLGWGHFSWKYIILVATNTAGHVLRSC